MKKVIIGFCAYSGDTALCKIPLVDLFQGLDMGEEFCLDEAAFTLFEEYAELSFFNI